jgi:hypothetical protein
VVKGSVAVRSGTGTGHRGRDGESLAAGTTLETAAASLVTIDYFDGSETRLGPEAEYELVELSRAAGGRIIRGRLGVGESFHDVVKLTATGSRFEVQVSSATAAVRGTRFAVRCVAPKPCGVAVVEGEVAVTPGPGFASVAPGDPVPRKAPVVVGPDRRVTIDDGGTLSPVVEIAPDDPWINQNR